VPAFYLYDANGSVTQAVSIAGGSTMVYQYDGENRLISLTAPGLTESFIYDGNGNKISQTVNGVTRNVKIFMRRISHCEDWILDRFRRGNRSSTGLPNAIPS
jgi:YD repeat-containing protein